MTFLTLPLFAALLVIIAVTGYAAWEMFRIARFWQDSEQLFFRMLSLFFKLFAVSMCLLVLSVTIFLMFIDGPVAIF